MNHMSLIKIHLKHLQPLIFVHVSSCEEWSQFPSCRVSVMFPDALFATWISPSSQFVYKVIFKSRRKWNHLQAIKGTSVTSILRDAGKEEQMIVSPPRCIFTPTAMEVKDHKRTTILLTYQSLWLSLKPQEILLVTYHKILRKVLEACGRFFILTMEKVQVKSVNTMKRNIWWTLRTIFPPSQQCKGVFVLFGGDFF